MATGVYQVARGAPADVTLTLGTVSTVYIYQSDIDISSHTQKK